MIYSFGKILDVNNMCKTKSNNVVILLILACFLSNISQLPFFVSSGLTQKINMPMWVFLLGYLLIANRVRFNHKTMRILVLLGVIVAGVMLLCLFTGVDYYKSSVFSCLMLSALIYFLGEFSGKSLREQDIKKIMLAYSASTLIVSAAIYVEFFSSGLNLNSKVYAYSSKNSISQIIFTSIVILIFTKAQSRKIVNLLRILAIAFQVFLLFVLRSRATIVGFIICLLYVIVGGDFNPKIKYSLGLVLCGTALALLFNEKFSDIIINNILFAGRNASSLDSLTSGRVSIIQTFPELIEGHWLTGIGPLYFECFPMSVILQFGALVGLLILIVSYLPVLESLRLRRAEDYGAIFLLICIGYAINSIFEGLAPIGPGVKCYFMWLLFGILSSKAAGGKSSSCQN